MRRFRPDEWALILGGSSGFGFATARKLCSEGMGVCVVHRDRMGAMSRIEKSFDEIRSLGSPFFSMNVDALSADGTEKILLALKEEMEVGGKIRVFLHSIAFGNLKPIVRGPSEAELAVIEEEDMMRTIQSMGSSLLTWTQKLFFADLFASDARVIGLTSEGNEIAWKGYAAVAAAKMVLESLSRAIAVEFGPHGIRSNIIQAGVTDTSALRLIPGSDKLKSQALARNPLKRLTLPEDVANAIYLLSLDEAAWINGALLRVDGGEHVAST